MLNHKALTLFISLSYSIFSFGSDAIFTSLDDQAVSLKIPAVINFWATWCAPCIKELPDLEELGRKLGNDATVYIVNFGEETKKITSFKANNPDLFGNHAVLIKDSKMAGLRTYGLIGVPTTILLDTGGNVVETIQGLKEWGSSELVAEIRAKIVK